MLETASNSYPATKTVVSFRLPAGGVDPQPSSVAEIFRSLAADLRRPLGAILARLNGRTDRMSEAFPHPQPGPEPPDLSKVDSIDLVREILGRVGDDPSREGLRKTPARIVRSWKEIYGGYAQSAEDILATQFQAEQYDEMILLRNIEFFSTCEHHMLPFHGKAHIAYLPKGRIVGLSKLARLTDMYARRLQVQERLTCQIASELRHVLKPKGVAVMIEAKHQCMCSRGVGKQEGKMITSCLLGAFKESLSTRMKFFSMVRE